MGKRVKVLLGATLAIAVLGISGAAIAGATGDDDDSEEAGDEEGAYEIEVTLDDGSQVDVHLDTGFNVINQADDGNEGGEDDNGDKD
jgi:hypothetical protein